MVVVDDVDGRRTTSTDDRRRTRIAGNLTFFICLGVVLLFGLSELNDMFLCDVDGLHRRTTHDVDGQWTTSMDENH